MTINNLPHFLTALTTALFLSDWWGLTTPFPSPVSNISVGVLRKVLVNVSRCAMSTRAVFENYTFRVLFMVCYSNCCKYGL